MLFSLEMIRSFILISKRLLSLARILDAAFEQQITSMVYDSRVGVMTLLAGYVAVRGAAYVRLFKFILGDEVTALNLAADDSEVPVKVNDSRNLLETAAVNYRFFPHESIT